MINKRIRKPHDPSKHYIKKEDLLKAVMEYQAKVHQCAAEAKPLPQQPDIIGRYVMMLCQQLGTRYNFSRYSYIDMMIDDGIEHCIKAITKFNPTKTDNIFNYFTTVAWRAFQQRIIEERKQNAIKHRHYQHTFRINELNGGEMITDASNNEYSNRVIEEYEQKHLNKAPLTKNAKANNMIGINKFVGKAKKK